MKDFRWNETLTTSMFEERQRAGRNGCNACQVERGHFVFLGPGLGPTAIRSVLLLKASQSCWLVVLCCPFLSIWNLKGNRRLWPLASLYNPQMAPCFKAHKTDRYSYCSPITSSSLFLFSVWNQPICSRFFHSITLFHVWKSHDHTCFTSSNMCY